MRDIIPRSIKNTPAFNSDIIRRPQIVVERRLVDTVVSSNEENGRIGKSPFFEKRFDKKIETKGTNNTKKPSSSVILWFFALAFLLIAGFLIANYFAGATVEVTPVTRSATVDHDFSISKDGDKNELTFQFMSLVEEKSKEIPASIEKKIQKKASGKVVIFNTYNSEKQRLIKNTRLESADHKIFRIEESVVVPGAKILQGKVIESGSVEAIVYSDAPGKEYNIGLADFTIPGFKGDPRYTKFTARSKVNSPISGGFSGFIKVLSDESITSAQEELKQDLKKISIEKARAQIPDGVSFFPGSIILKFEEVPQEFTTEDTAKVLVRATVSVFFFDTNVLVKKLTEISLPQYGNSIFTVPNMSALTFSFTDPVDNVVLSDLAKIRFHLSGDAVFVGKINEEKIRTALAGKDKKDFGKIIVEESNVGKAEAVIRPMWKTVFPNDPAKIAIKILGE